jgi:outer membrane immunogenic protein
MRQGGVMKKLLLGSSALALLAGATFLTYGQALAASPDDLDREKAQLRKENADLRELLRMRDENAALRAHLQAPARIVPTKPPSQAARAELVHGVPAAALTNLYDADMSVPVYKASPPPIAYYNWTGFYVGGNIGYSVGDDRLGQTLAIPANGVADVNFADGVVAPKGVLGGVQLGYNWQGGRNWLTGIEFDFQGASQQDKACGLTCETASATGVTLQQTLNVEQKLQYFGTARARLGVVDDNVLFYVTGGGAYGRVNETTNVILNSGAPNPATFSSSQITDNRFGWVAGAGIEAALWGNWTAKAEYLYMDLGHLAANISAVAFPGAPPIAATLTTTSSIRDNIVRAGVNYRFGPEMAGGGLYDSAPASYAPAVYRWTGVYVGGNIGYAQGDNRISQTAVETAPLIVAGASDNSVITPKGFAGGLQVGYNWQGGANWLAGFEADIQGTNQSDTACTPIFCISQTSAAGGGNSAVTAKQSIDYFATMRGRLGLVNNNILFYGTGGVALGHVNETVAINDTLIAPAAFNTSSTSADLIGWVVGGGIEAAVLGNWTAKAEYLYMDLGSISNTLAVPSQTTTFMTSSTVKDHIFRVGANYHL